MKIDGPFYATLGGAAAEAKRPTLTPVSFTHCTNEVSCFEETVNLRCIFTCT